MHETAAIPEVFAFIRKGDYNKVKECIGDIDVNKIYNGEITLLSYACLFGQLDIIELLLENGVDVNYRNSLDSTPLIEAINYENPKTAIFLIEKGADVEVMSKLGSSPLLLSIIRENETLFDFIISRIKSKTSIEKKDHYGRSPLMHAAIKGNVHMGKVLIDKGASINITDLNGDTALNLAVRNQRIDFCKMICSYDPIHTEGSNGCYPKDYAVRVKNLGLLAALSSSWLGQI